MQGIRALRGSSIDRIKAIGGHIAAERRKLRKNIFTKILSVSKYHLLSPERTCVFCEHLMAI